MIDIDNQDPRPIWRQIEQGVQWLIARGVYGKGSPVPSVRQLAREIRVNPATVSKAYQKLVDSGVLEVRRGEGTFVRDGVDARSTHRRHGKLETEARRLVAWARTLGFDEEEVHRAIAGQWRRSDSQEEGRDE